MRAPILLNIEKQKEFELNGFVTIPFLNEDEVNVLKQNYKKEDFSSPEGFYSTSFSNNDTLKQQLESSILDIVGAKAEIHFHKHQQLGGCYLSKAPGAKGEMPLHQDWTVVDESKFDSITIWIPLIDVDEKNGALQVIPGSHRFSNALRSPLFDSPLSEIQQDLKQDLQLVKLKAGEAIIFSQALIHASPANQSEQERLAVTYGLIHKEAQLLFYYKNQEGLAEKYEVPIDFFKKYNTQIGEKPQIGKCVDTFNFQENKITPKEYLKAKRNFTLLKNKNTNMIPLFKKQEHQSFFEKEGYLVLPLLDENEVKNLYDYYESLKLKDENGFGFHVSMDNLDKELCVQIRAKIWSIILPKLDNYLENYIAFVASYVIKETNPKGVVPAHQDWSFVDKEEEGYCSITCWTALVDTVLDNGCMGVIKGSHKFMQNHRPSPSPQAPVPLSEHMFSIFPYLTTLEMKAGEVLFFDNRTFHASPPNTMDGVRLAAGVGITQKDAKFVHYNLKSDGSKSVLQKYAIDEDFFLKYDNTKLSKMYENGETIQNYELLEELPYVYDDYTSEELVQIIKNSGNEFNVPMCEKLSVLFGYDMSGKKKVEEEIPQEEIKEEEQEEWVDNRSFLQTYTPMNILREIKNKITSK